MSIANGGTGADMYVPQEEGITVMSTEACVKTLITALLAVATLLGGTTASAQDEREYAGVRLHLDNDLFAGGERDRDYTGGLAVAVSGAAAREGFLSLDPVLARLDALTSNESARVYSARQFGLITFTPKDIEAHEPQFDDRPYASLLFAANGRLRVDADERRAWSSSLTIGVLGLSLSEHLQSAIHDVVGSEKPRGYKHQISAGGEPTARYSLARHMLWYGSASGMVDVKATVQGSLGYLTEASAALSLRIGRLDSPWWSFAPELADYIAAPVPIAAVPRRAEHYVFTGIRLKARAYNAFLQGQFRNSTVRFSASELEPLLLEAWVGFVVQLLEHTQLSYSLNYQTSEVREGIANRDVWWGAVQLTHTF
ncbi:MAG: lipid A deacylase LpxR family protein [Gammaproteobacteria bacterium]|nr:DUF2219 domain-containing protein [Gammaproteobacteria bacterium]